MLRFDFRVNSREKAAEISDRYERKGCKTVVLDHSDSDQEVEVHTK